MSGVTYTRTWARLQNSVVVEVQTTESHMPSPFGETTDRVIDVSGVPAAVGYVADTMGNVAPPPQYVPDLTSPVEPGTEVAPAMMVTTDPQFGHHPQGAFMPSGTAGIGMPSKPENTEETTDGRPTADVVTEEQNAEAARAADADAQNTTHEPDKE